jgi:hypothetical protein
VLGVAVLGVLNFVLGFLRAYGVAYVGGSIPVLSSVGAYAPVLFLVAGLVAAGAFLPGGRRHDYQTSVLSVAAAVGALATFLLAEPPLAIGAILLLVFGAVQALAAVGALVLGRMSRDAAAAAGPGGHPVAVWNAPTGPGPAVPPNVPYQANPASSVGQGGAIGPASYPAGTASVQSAGVLPAGQDQTAAGRAVPWHGQTGAAGGDPGGNPTDGHDISDGDDPEATRIVRF